MPDQISLLPNSYQLFVNLPNYNWPKKSRDVMYNEPENSYKRGRISMVDLSLTMSAIFILKIQFSFFTKQPMIMRKSTMLSLFLM